jgi:hypothetical protein
VAERNNLKNTRQNIENAKEPIHKAHYWKFLNLNPPPPKIRGQNAQRNSAHKTYN